ncbi:MAG TPA: radical SAM protein [Geobacter sp.]|nr:radical SAM protein [Geobacter sp.]
MDKQLAQLRSPSKLFVETTTRCNLGCFMCVKQTCDHAIVEGDMSLTTFAALQPAFSGLEALVLNGVGEPLLNQNLEAFIRQARSSMPKDSWIGFQSNGKLLDESRAVSLLEAGLDRICISIDSISEETFRKVRDGGELDDISDAFSALASAKRRTGRDDFRIGVEFVAMQGNLHELPEAIAWSARRGASFALVTHVLPYDSQHADESVYGRCSDEALALFQKWQSEAEREGLDIYAYFEISMKYSKTPVEQRLMGMVDAMKAEAEANNVSLNLKKLLSHDHGRSAEVSAVFDTARAVAEEVGLELRLPEVMLKEKRSCTFVEEGGAFVAWDGSISPCYFLWHRYSCFASGWSQQVQQKVFGNVNEQGVLDIWNGAPFRSFRTGVTAYDYAHCASCSLAPCDYVQTDSFEQDCHIRDVPCGACLWCAGIFQCL